MIAKSECKKQKKWKLISKSHLQHSDGNKMRSNKEKRKKGFQEESVFSELILDMQSVEIYSSHSNVL